MNEYFTERDAIEYPFYRVPKALITDPQYHSVSTDAKLLYGLLLDRMDLSVKKRWLDEHGRVYLYYTIASIQTGLCCCKEKACNLLRELEYAGLIDTLQKIRDMKSENYCYAGDYRTMSILKAIADRFHIAILLIHHTRKQPSADPFDMISGTTGLMGCADSSFVLRKDKRLSEFADFYGTGRDIEDLHFSLRFNLEEKCWDLVSSNRSIFGTIPICHRIM